MTIESTTHDPLTLVIRILISIRDELRRTTDFELAQRQQEWATREMRRARLADCGNCLYLSPVDWDWLESRGRTLPIVQMTGHCTAQTLAPTRKPNDPTERLFDSPPCGRYEARCWPDGSPIDSQEESDDC